MLDENKSKVLELVAATGCDCKDKLGNPLDECDKTCPAAEAQDEWSKMREQIVNLLKITSVLANSYIASLKREGAPSVKDIVDQIVAVSAPTNEAVDKRTSLMCRQLQEAIGGAWSPEHGWYDAIEMVKHVVSERESNGNVISIKAVAERDALIAAASWKTDGGSWTPSFTAALQTIKLLTGETCMENVNAGRDRCGVCRVCRETGDTVFDNRLRQELQAAAGVGIKDRVEWGQLIKVIQGMRATLEGYSSARWIIMSDLAQQFIKAMGLTEDADAGQFARAILGLIQTAESKKDDRAIHRIEELEKSDEKHRSMLMEVWQSVDVVPEERLGGVHWGRWRQWWNSFVPRLRESLGLLDPNHPKVVSAFSGISECLDHIKDASTLDSDKRAKLEQLRSEVDRVGKELGIVEEKKEAESN